MTPVIAIALKDLRQRLRDRSALVLGFVAPIVIAAVMSFAFGGVQTFHLTAAVVDDDRAELSAAFTAALTSPELADLVTVVPVTGDADARAALADGRVSVVFEIPAGFSAAARDGAAVPVTVLGSVDDPVASQVGTSVAEAFVAQVNAVRLSVATAVAGGAPLADLADLATAAARRTLPEQVAGRSQDTRQLNAISYFGPAMGMFFAMFAIGFTAKSFFVERGGGTLDRISVAPVRPGVVLAGKSLATFAYAAASLTTMAAVTTAVFDAYWGPPAVAAALIAALALALTALTALVIAVARSERQAEGFASMLSFTLVLLGGNFVFISTAPPLLRRLALLTPNGWALRAFTDLGTGAAASAALLPIAVITGFAAVTAGAAALLAGRMVRR